jgi:hypothetical protein
MTIVEALRISRKLGGDVVRRYGAPSVSYSWHDDCDFVIDCEDLVADDWEVVIQDRTTETPVPICCGAPMRPSAIPGWICNGGVDPMKGKGCERHEAPDGVRTPGAWWRESPGLSTRTLERLRRAGVKR